MAGSADFPYSPVPGSVKRLLEKIPTVGRPEKMDQRWLSAMGFSGGNNSMSIALFKQVGIVDNSGTPTEMWTALRAKDRAKVAAGIRNAYGALFAMYPDAHRQDDEALTAFARARTDYAEGTQRAAVRTFRVFAEFGDFDAAPAGAATTLPSADERIDRGDEKRPERGKDRARPGGVGLTVNIQLQLPPTSDGEIYDKLFEAMAKHLKGLTSLE